MNLDWSLCEALKNTNVSGIDNVLHIYDVNCQYYVHLKERIEKNEHLKIDERIQLHHAIGLFHVHGHQDECLYRFATTYVPGAGVVDGEILETLWAVLNTVSTSTRTASLASRTELLDDQMGDSNFKKMLNICKCHLMLKFLQTTDFCSQICFKGKTIIAKYHRALDNATSSREYFDDLDRAAPQAQRDEWKESIEVAEKARLTDVDEMDYMLPQYTNGATLKEIEADMAKQDSRSPDPAADNGSITSWLIKGLKIEDSQFVLSNSVIVPLLISLQG